MPSIQIDEPRGTIPIHTPQRFVFVLGAHQARIQAFDVQTNILLLSYRPSLFKLFIWGHGLTELASLCLCKISQKGLEIAILLPQLQEEIGLKAYVAMSVCMSSYISLELNSFAGRALFASTVFSSFRESFPTAGCQYFSSE